MSYHQTEKELEFQMSYLCPVPSLSLVLISVCLCLSFILLPKRLILVPGMVDIANCRLTDCKCHNPEETCLSSSFDL